MNILGLNVFHADTSACIVKDGHLIAATEEERQLSLQVCDRLHRVLKYYHPEDAFVTQLASRKDSLEKNINDYQDVILGLSDMSVQPSEPEPQNTKVTFEQARSFMIERCNNIGQNPF